MLGRAIVVFIMCVILTLGMRAMNRHTNPAQTRIEEQAFPRTAVANWLEQTLVQSFSFDNTNFKDVFRQVNYRYHPTAYEEFGGVIAKLGVIPLMQRSELVVKAEPVGIPYVVASGITNGSYEWAIDIDISLGVKQGQAVEVQKVPLRFRCKIQQRMLDDKHLGLIIIDMKPLRQNEGMRL